jgi:hypothetical protein
MTPRAMRSVWAPCPAPDGRCRRPRELRRGPAQAHALDLQLHDLGRPADRDRRAAGLHQRPAETIFGGILRWIVALSPLAIVFAMSFGANRFSTGTLQAMFWGFAVLMGLSLSTIFLVLHRRLDRGRPSSPPRRPLPACQPVRLHHQEGPVRHGQLPDHGRDRPARGHGAQHLPAVARVLIGRSASSAC